MAISIPWDKVGLTVALDTESSGLHPDDGARVSTVSVAWQEGGEVRALALPFGQGPRGDGTLFDMYADEGERVWNRLGKWLQRQDLVGHNIKFDIHQMTAGTVLGYAGVDLADRVWSDTMIVEWVLDPVGGIGLDQAGQRYAKLGKEDSGLKAALKKTRPRNRYDLIPWDVMEPYARVDAELALRIHLAQVARLEAEDSYLEPWVQEEMRILRLLIEMERRGIGYDAHRSNAAAYAAEEVVRKLEKELPFTASEAAARHWFYVEQGALPHCVTKGGKTSVAECCVRQLIAQGVRGADTYAAWKKASTSIAMWYTGYAEKVGADGRLRTDFRQTGTISFRWASQRVNLQALPHDHRVTLPAEIPRPRSLFQAAPGYVLYEMDLSQAELRVAAKTAKCKGLLAFLEDDNADAHGETAKALFPSEYSAQPKKFRDIAKRANFSFIYLVGPPTFQKDLEKQTGIKITLRQAEEVVHGWRSLYPEIPRINRRAENVARKRGYITLVDGRQRHFKPYEELHKSFNQYVQGSIAQFMKKWALAIEAFWPGTLLLQIHDSLIVEIPEGEAEMAQAMSDLGAQMATKLFRTRMKSDVKIWG